ncbi:unnamed protein product [Adineta steineri]|uniref:Uncharacterized protein n=1 Tax=Adineta steineri TaxID=433720 RepID=A0A814MJP2_9BILA|nr:unnamed protein product [Adineta steineri]
MNIYLLRCTTAEEKYKIKCYVNNDVKFNFNRDKAFDEKGSMSPYIYKAEVDLIINKQDHLFLKLQNGSLPIQNYRLRLSRRIPQTEKTYRDYNDDKERYFDNPRSTQHYFLFDVNFARNFADGPPGTNLFINKKII